MSTDSNLSFEITSSGPPAGVYSGEFVGVEKTTHEEFGAGLRFVFKIKKGDCKGMEASRITGVRATAKNALGKMLAGLTGQKLTPGAKIDLAGCVGQEYLLSVQETQSGSTRVETAIRSQAD